MTPTEFMQRAARVKMMIFDVDGVLTDGSLTYGPDGEVTKTFNVLDGLGIQLLNKTGVKTAIISARKSPIVVKRAADLGITVITLDEVRRRGATPGGHPSCRSLSITSSMRVGSAASSACAMTRWRR